MRIRNFIMKLFLIAIALFVALKALPPGWPKWESSPRREAEASKLPPIEPADPAQPYREAEPVFVPDIKDDVSGACRWLTAEQKNLYNALKRQIIEIAEGKRNSTVFPVHMESYGFEGPVGSDVTKEVINALYADLPYELYWYDSRNGLMICTVDDIITEFRFYVSEDYSAGGGEKTFVTSPKKLEAAKRAAENAKKVVAENEGKSDIEKLRAYKDYICGQADYDFIAFSEAESAPLGPWHLINVFDEDPDTNVVCEGYAKAFQYLCDLSDFDFKVKCYRVSGTLTSENYEYENLVDTSCGPHAWNIVRIEDQSYLVDVTNCDGGKSGAFTVDEYGELKEGAESGDLFFMLNLGAVSGYAALPAALAVSGSVDSGYSVDRGEISFDIGHGQIRTFFRHIAKYEYDDFTIKLYPNEVLDLDTAD